MSRLMLNVYQSDNDSVHVNPEFLLHSPPASAIEMSRVWARSLEARAEMPSFSHALSAGRDDALRAAHVREEVARVGVGGVDHVGAFDGTSWSGEGPAMWFVRPGRRWRDRRDRGYGSVGVEREGKPFLV